MLAWLRERQKRHRSTQARLAALECRLVEIDGAIAGLVVRMQSFHHVVDSNARACNENFTKVEQALRASAESIKGVGNMLREWKGEDDGDWWKRGQSS